MLQIRNRPKFLHIPTPLSEKMSLGTQLWLVSRLVQFISDAHPFLCTHFSAIWRLSWLLCSSQGYCGMSIWRNMDWCLVHHHDICSPYSNCHTLICHSTALHHLVCQHYVYSGYEVAAAKTWLIAASFPTLVMLQLNPVISQYYFLLLGRGIWVGRHVQISSLYYVTV